MSHFLQYVSDMDYFLGIDEVSSYFSFCDGRHDYFDYLCYVENGSAVGRNVIISGQERMTSCSTYCSWFAVITCFAVYFKDCVASVICDKDILL